MPQERVENHDMYICKIISTKLSYAAFIKLEEKKRGKH